MNKADIMHLGTLARIEIDASEVPNLQKDIQAVLEYVSDINNIKLDSDLTLEPALINVLRKDEVTNEPGSYTEVLLAEAPKVQKQMVVVPKILNPDS